MSDFLLQRLEDIRAAFAAAVAAVATDLTTYWRFVVDADVVHALGTWRRRVRGVASTQRLSTARMSLVLARQILVLRVRVIIVVVISIFRNLLLLFNGRLCRESRLSTSF